MGALKEFHLYPFSPNGGEGWGEGEGNLFSAPLNNFGGAGVSPVQAQAETSGYRKISFAGLMNAQWRRRPRLRLVEAWTAEGGYPTFKFRRGLNF